MRKLNPINSQVDFQKVITCISVNAPRQQKLNPVAVNNTDGRRKMKEIPFQIFQIESWAQIPEGLRAMQEDIERRVIPAQAEGKKWDYMRVELWPDSGRFIAFPAHSEEEFRVEVTGCQLVCKEIVSDFMAIESTGENLGSEVEKIYDRMVALANPAFEQLSCESFELWDAEGNQR